MIAGNHDSLLQESPELALPALSDAFYLQDSGVEVEGIDINPPFLLDL
ncbi:hypothetical protein [Vreelandella utahensis]|nr:hypothetical protein [Halomonas utahensis]